jgi:hypothetical protein
VLKFKIILFFRRYQANPDRLIYLFKAAHAHYNNTPFYDPFARLVGSLVTAGFFNYNGLTQIIRCVETPPQEDGLEPANFEPLLSTFKDLLEKI